MLQRCEGCGKIPNHNPRVSLDVSELIEQLRYGPYGAQRSEVRHVVENIDKDIEDHQSDILDLKRRLTSFNSNCDRLRSMRTMYIGLISPIRALPNELLTLVFEYCCATNDFGAYPRPKIPALEISQVCSRWRRLALASPGLWSIISVDLNEPANKHERQLVSLFRLFVHRSQDHLLDLEMDLSRWHPPANSNQYKEHPIMEIAVANAHRWTKFTIKHFSGSPFQSKAFESLRALPLLESMTVIQIDPDWVAHMDPPLDYAPKLTELALHGFVLDARAHHFSWHTLTSLSLSAYTPSLFTILRSCSSLTNLSLDLTLEPEYQEPDFPAAPSSPVQLTLLRSMSLTSAGSHPSEAILSSVTVPSLTELHLSCCGSQTEDTWLTVDIHAFLTRSKCSLAKFTLEHSAVSDTVLITFLRYLPLLRELFSDARGFPPDAPIIVSDLLLKSLHAFDASAIQPLLPNLSRLMLAMDRRTKERPVLNDDLLVKAVASRWVPESIYATEIRIAGIREVELFFTTEEFDWAPYQRLRELGDAGMTLGLYNSRYLGFSS